MKAPKQWIQRSVAFASLLAFSSIAEAKTCKITQEGAEIGTLEATDQVGQFVIDPEAVEPRGFRCVSKLAHGFGSLPMVSCGFGDFKRDKSDPNQVTFDRWVYSSGFGALKLTVGPVEITCF